MFSLNSLFRLPCMPIACYNVGPQVSMHMDILYQSHISTIDSIVANIEISDVNGNILCCLDHVELARHESLLLLPSVHRYDVVFQSMDIPYTPTAEHNTLVDTPDMGFLYNALDRKAITATTRTLREELSVGGEVGINFQIELVSCANYAFIARPKALL